MARYDAGDGSDSSSNPFRNQWASFNNDFFFSASTDTASGRRYDGNVVLS